MWADPDPDMTCLRSIPITTKEVQVMFNSMKSLLLASVLSLTAASAALAGGHSTSGDFHSGGASAAPICDGTGRSQKTANDGRLSRDWCRVIAGDGGPGTAGDDNGRT